MVIKILPLPEEKKKQKYKDVSELGFGKIFTDRMFLAEWKKDSGWINAEIKPYGPFQLDPSAIVFHYGQEIFEGLKAYALKDERIALFRPEMNARRFNLSAERLCMPPVPEDLFLAAIENLVDLEREWIPRAVGTSLYIRPTMIAVEAALGVKPASHYYFYVILCPVGPYYASGYNPIKILVEDHFVRAVRGGTGEAKTGGNYASSLKASLEAKMKGFDQVLWLDGTTREIVEEVGAMNMFFVYGKKIMTAPLDGSILHGITRDSILKLAPELGFEVEEKRMNINELMEDIATGKVTEAFGSGTAAVVTPVGTIGYKGQALEINRSSIGPVTQKLYDTLTQIQYGKEKDPFGWMKIVEPGSIKKRLDRLFSHQFL